MRISLSIAAQLSAKTPKGAISAKKSKKTKATDLLDTTYSFGKGRRNSPA
jgi:hypothetical protein